jgi:hypothetical protein
MEIDSKLRRVNQGDQPSFDREIAGWHIAVAQSQQAWHRIKTQQVGGHNVRHLIREQAKQSPSVLHDDNDMHRRQSRSPARSKVEHWHRLAVQHERNALCMRSCSHPKSHLRQTRDFLHILDIDSILLAAVGKGDELHALIVV